MSGWSVVTDPMPPAGCGAPATVATCRTCGHWDLTIDDHTELNYRMDAHDCPEADR